MSLPVRWTCLVCLALAGWLSSAPVPIERAGAQEQPAGATSRSQEHWSFRARSSPAVPTVRNSDWTRNSIDSFVLATLEQAGIAPSPEADRATLVRRLSLDLIGLPPTPAEVDAFVTDARPDAYERLVERLLASPHFGERWARHWLDLARYADSDGYEKDSPRPYAYLYRNWVIDAMNRDLPFDRFTIEQLAGDLAPGEPGESPETALARNVATGFHRNTLTNKEGGVDQEEFRNKANVDRVSTTSTVWLGLTLACCECHNHKYDPFTQQEFYSLFSFFNTSQETDVPAPQPAELAAYEAAKKKFDDEHAKLAAALADFERDQLPGRLAAWEAARTGKTPVARWVVLAATTASSTGGATLTEQPDGSILVAGTSPATDTYTIEAKTDLAGITAFRLEVLPDEKHPAKGPGRVKHGNFVLNEFTVKFVPPSTPARRASEGNNGQRNDTSNEPSLALRASVPTEPQPVPLQNATADFSQDKYSVAAAIDGNVATGWAIAPQFGKRHVAVFETKEDLAPAAADSRLTLVITLDQQYGTEHTIGRFRISATTEPRPVSADDLPDDVIAALRTAPAERDEKQKAAVTKYYRSTDAEWKKLDAALAEHAKKAPPAPATKAMAIAQNGSPPPTHIHIRGDFLRKGDAVDPGTPAVLATAVSFQPRSAKPDRLDLARWIVSPANPLTPRVAVNRTWQYLFGKGLVATPNDFGTRGERPSHPELLDWLAGEFVARGWSQKDLIRLVVGSATYRQSSRARQDLVDRDPTNTLLARQNRYRLEAEIVRDLNLAASGLLALTIGGPSVRPPQPAGVSDLTYAGSAKWNDSTGADRYRRGLYTWFQRTSPYPMLTTFDSPDGVNCTVRRERSNTPLQALTLLNDAVFVECAQSLARRAIKESPSADLSARIRFAFRSCMAREPNTQEMVRLAKLRAELLDTCRANPESAAKLLGPQPPAGIATDEAAAWVALARTILNLDEFVTRE